MDSKKHLTSPSPPRRLVLGRNASLYLALEVQARRNFVANLLRTTNNGNTHKILATLWLKFHSFWGVFTVDASTQETAQQSFVAIAKLCGIDPNERAAKSWLSSSDRPWLLLIDNADDTKLEVERYLPDGEHGLTIITTRNPSIKMYGTIGQRFYHFDRLDDGEASQLLLRAAEHHDPPTPPIMQWTTTITKALGGLPLALIHAGNAIKAKYCSLNDYLVYYDQSWQMIRESRRINSYGKGDNGNMDEYIQVYSSYEILYRGLEAMEYQRFKDALQLLQLFSFFHHEHIPFDVLIAAVRHPRIERKAQEEMKELDKSDETGNDQVNAAGIVEQPNSWPKYLRELVLGKLEKHFANRYQTLLPTFLLDAELSPPPDDFNVRLRKALGELVRLSLITYHDTSDSFSMHPLVHTWVRERPQMTTRDQAVWCEAALTTITRCILLPPLSNSVESHADLPRKLLPHLLTVEKREQRIRAEFVNNQKTLWRPWPPALKAGGIHAKKSLQMARFSLVYAQCGYFVEAETRQRTVRDFVYRMRGPDHPRAMDITLALAGTLWQQSRSNEAADLQEQVLQGCLRTLGPEHLRTLKVMDALGEGRRQQGRLRESIDLHQSALDGMKTKLLGTDPAMFHALDHLGITLWYCFRFEEAKEHQEKAVSGLKRLLGENDLETLLAIESLARTYQSLGAEHLQSNEQLGRHYLEMAQRNIMFVIEQRTKQLGDKQPYTWLAKSRLGAIMGAMGELEEGERLISSLIPMAVAHLGEDHLGVLAGKNELARILMNQKRYAEAEVILLEISRPEKYCKTSTATGDHPDRCDALWSLLDCYHKQDKIADGLRTCDELEAVIVALRRGEKTVGSTKFSQMIQYKRAELQATENARLIDNPQLDFLEVGSSTMELRLATLRFGVNAVSSDIQVPAGSGDVRQR
jgi:tetratricopeptide (TPR) repeat protein